MALRAVPEHPKFAAFRSKLRLRKNEALGYLELLWHMTGKYAPQGNIGKFPDAEIEAWLDWDGERGILVAALVETRWLDGSAQHRLVVHDWHEHADSTTKKMLGRKNLQFLSGHGLDMSRTKGKMSSPPEPAPEADPEPEPGAGPDPSSDSGADMVHRLRARETEVDLVYNAYPRKVGKGEALTAIRKAVAHLVSGKDIPSLSESDALKLLHDKVTLFTKSPAGSAGKFTPHPATWFNQRRYLDDEREWWHGTDQKHSTRNRGQDRVHGQLAALQRADEADTDTTMACRLSAGTSARDERR